MSTVCLCKMPPQRLQWTLRRFNSEFSGLGFSRVARPGAYPSDNSKRITARSEINNQAPSARRIAC